MPPPPPPRRAPARGLPRAAVFAFGGAALAQTAGCYDHHLRSAPIEPPARRDAGLEASVGLLYGTPPEPDPFDAGLARIRDAGLAPDAGAIHAMYGGPSPIAPADAGTDVGEALVPAYGTPPEPIELDAGPDEDAAGNVVNLYGAPPARGHPHARSRSALSRSGSGVAAGERRAMLPPLVLFVRKAALRPVPKWAVVDEVAVSAVEDALGDEGDELQQALDGAYREMDRRQPALARWLGEQVSGRSDDLAQSLGYFLVVTVYMGFREAFPTRLGTVPQHALDLALATLDADEELRANDPTEVLESDDIIAITQPVLLHFVQHHLDQALEQAGEQPNLEAFDQIYRAILVEVIALSQAVAPPEGTPPESAGLA